MSIKRRHIIILYMYYHIIRPLNLSRLMTPVIDICMCGIRTFRVCALLPWKYYILNANARKYIDRIWRTAAIERREKAVQFYTVNYYSASRECSHSWLVCGTAHSIIKDNNNNIRVRDVIFGVCFCRCKRVVSSKNIHRSNHYSDVIRALV